MTTRRNFLRGMGGIAAGVTCLACGQRRASAQTRAARREVGVNGQRVRTVDIHCHCVVPETLDLVKGTAMESRVASTIKSQQNNPTIEARIAEMDVEGIDVEAMSINAWWYGAERDLARRIIDTQNEKLVKMCALAPDRLVAFASVSLQFPELAAEQLEIGMKQQGLRGAAIGGTVEGQELSHPKFDPFWKKAEELQALLFMHPQDSAKVTGVAERVKGGGGLENVIGNPLETTIAISHLIFEGVMDRFPNLKISFAHGGGFLPSYAARMDNGCGRVARDCAGPVLKKKPSEYLRQMYFDSLVFTPEALRHLVAECGASQIMIGTDYNYGWVKDPVGHVMDTPQLSDADRIAILGGTAAKLLRL
jgi:aminocarboxymuconate-semialdehyde decarboxylase